MKKGLTLLIYIMMLSLQTIKANDYSLCMSASGTNGSGTITIAFNNNATDPMAVPIQLTEFSIILSSSNPNVTFSPGFQVDEGPGNMFRSGLIATGSIIYVNPGTNFSISVNFANGTPGNITFRMDNFSVSASIYIDQTTLVPVGCSAATVAILPIELLNFQGKEKDKTIQLNWQTASESDNEGFYVQRSSDGQNFKNIGFVKGTGTSDKVQYYSYIDNVINQLSYYRLLQQDFNGKQSYSKVISIENEYFLKLYPNPAKDQIYINFNDKIEDKLFIYDITGKILMQKNILNNSCVLEIGDLPNGIYILKSASSKNSYRFIKD